MRMREFARLLLLLLLLLAGTANCSAWVKAGSVLCDANGNSLIDAGDVGVSNVLVVVTNTSGTFSNAAFTGADGSFAIALPAVPDSYVDFLQPASLPPLTLAVLPPLQLFETSPTQTMITNHFLIQNVFCLTNFFTSGRVVCDVNGNGQIDTNDQALAGVVLGITNLTGTFSNAAVTGPDGKFLLRLPEAGTYGEFPLISTLPAQAVILVPPGGVSLVTVGPSQPLDVSNFLIASPGCQRLGPTNCWLSGGGTLKAGRGRPLHTFGGALTPGRKQSSTGDGLWTDTDQVQKLRFKAKSLQLVGCGSLPGDQIGSKGHKAESPLFMEFQGFGTLRGFGANKVNYGTVAFYARVEDYGRPGQGLDRYYLRVSDMNGNTLLLVSANPTNALEVAPVAISTGNLELHPRQAPTR